MLCYPDRLFGVSTLHKSLPQHPLFLPVRQDSDCTHFTFAEAGDVVGGGFKVEDRLLDVWGEIGEIEDLRYASAGNAGDTSDLGLVFDLATGE